MGVNKPTFSVILDTRRSKQDGTYPLKLRVTFNRARKYFGLGIDLTQEYFDKLSSTKLRDERLKDIRVQITAFEARAETVNKSLNEFSFKEFEGRYFGDSEAIGTSNVYVLMEQYVQKLKSEGRISSAQSYNNTAQSLKAYKAKLNIEEVNVPFLNGYEKHMLDKGRSSTTVGIYLRSLRTIYNQAIEKGIVNKESYPFKKNRFSIPASRNIKKALTLEEIGKIFSYPTLAGTSEDKAKDFWKFSYLCNGLNLKDICLIKYKDIDGDTLSVVRAKTKLTTKSNQIAIRIPLTEEAKTIISKWGQKPELPNSNVFDILPSDVEPQRERELVQYFNKLVNKYMKRIGQELEISKPITTYTARHSFSTVLKRSGAPVEFISESLGHKNLSTTEAYLDSFEDDVKKQYSSLLTKF